MVVPELHCKTRDYWNLCGKKGMCCGRDNENAV
jgi:hypothetical protein